MTSERANHANRLNAMASTGPRTREGKKRSGQNARKHGLSAAGQTPEAKVEVARLIELIIAEYGANEVTREAARSLAEAQVQVLSVRAFKTTFLRNVLLSHRQTKEANRNQLPEILPDTLQILEGLERYERRAFSGRKTAIRRLVNLKIEANASLRAQQKS